ncbi:MAG: hypothetical protein II840_09775 [Kiritimatiellae bacterium]|nr:hypothetical protein [Kiritimatiellia bacterium]
MTETAKGLAGVGEQNRNNNRSRAGRKPRRNIKVKVLKRTWMRTGTGTHLVSEEIVEELRDSRGRKVGFRGHPCRTPKCRMGGGNFFRAANHAYSLVDRALSMNGGAR